MFTNFAGSGMRKTVNIGDKKIGEREPCFIVAEVGVNHNGDIKLAKKLVDAAKQSGADAVKFQTFKTENLVTRDAPPAEYQKKYALVASQYGMLKKLELSEAEFRELSSYCGKKKIIFLSTPFDSQSAEFLYKLGVPAFKISSGDLTNVPLLKQIAKYDRPIILSTGMSSIKEIGNAVKVINSVGNKELILLHCTSSYPADIGDVNLRAMDTLRDKFGTLVGYSDHTEGIEISIVACARGARIIEKHFTLNKSLRGPDHAASIEPEEFKTMVSSIRRVEISLGSGLKKITSKEKLTRDVVRKSIVTAVRVPKGTKLKKEMLTIKRPGTGIPPEYFDKILGKKTKIDIGRDRVLTWAVLI